MLILMCLISCLFGFANVQPIDHMQKEINSVELKTKNNYVQTSSGYYEYATSDLFSNDFLVGLIKYYVDDLGVSGLSYNNNTNVSQYIIQTSNVYTIYGYSNVQYYKLYDVANIVMDKQCENYPLVDFPVINYKFTFSNASPYNKQVTINWYAQRTIDNRLTIWGVQYILPNGSIQIENNPGTFNRDEMYPYFKLSEKTGGYNAFIGNIFNSIKGDPYNNGYNAGYLDGYNNAVSSIQNDPLNAVYQSIYGNGYQVGYAEGYATGLDTDSTALTIMTGIVEVGLLPINVFLKMFEYEVFGINIAGVVSGLFTIAVVVIVIRMITGKKND